MSSDWPYQKYDKKKNRQKREYKNEKEKWHKKMLTGTTFLRHAFQTEVFT